MKKFNLSLLFGLIVAVLLSFARFDTLCNDLRSNVLRLHIIANSDSADDQNLKLAVRDAILENFGDDFAECDNLSQANEFAKNNADDILKIAKATINQYGYDYSVSANVGLSYFTNREYDDFTLPAGNYESLNIVIGEGKGKNWWCVCFPAVCIGASGDLSDSVCEDSANIAKSSEKYEIKFKTVEIYEELRKIIFKK
ncbi:MAG: stage II sporulation protein R [Acutalibacteraceae bacterium]|nr:stage II sporulation protein R [Acutalibacteraceae bacterium]